MNNNTILIVALVAAGGIGVAFMSTGIMASAPGTHYILGACTDTCTLVTDVNSDGICEAGVDVFATVPAAPIDPSSFPLCP